MNLQRLSRILLKVVIIAVLIFSMASCNSKNKGKYKGPYGIEYIKEPSASFDSEGMDSGIYLAIIEYSQMYCDQCFFCDNYTSEYKDIKDTAMVIVENNSLSTVVGNLNKKSFAEFSTESEKFKSFDERFKFTFIDTTGKKVNLPVLSITCKLISKVENPPIEFINMDMDKLNEEDKRCKRLRYNNEMERRRKENPRYHDDMGIPIEELF